MTDRNLSQPEKKLLACLLLFYREIGPAATPGLRGLDDEAGLTALELDDAVRRLRANGLIEFWELSPAIRLTREGLLLAQHIHINEGC